ncbi:MAG: hypothetical protein GEU83_08680 [Pseudonocardiaceae bacterium]|nr:hypothetical protein [Pseudonocardiaceae bacterium]
MRISLRRVLLVAVASGGLLLGAAAPALAAPDVDLDDVTDQVSELTDTQLQEEDDLLQPVNDLLCSLLELELLGECPGDPVAAPQPVPEKPKPVGDKKHDAGKGVSDDAGAAPVGGVETGAGGTADDGPGLVLPLSVLGGATALTGGAIAGARYLRGNQDS